jgi:hypothetical protein
MNYPGKEELERLFAPMDTVTNDTSLSLETPPKLSDWMDEDDRFSRNNPFLSSSDTDWINSLYTTLYPLPVSKRHQDTFSNIITNLSLRKEKIFLSLHRKGYKGTYLPPYFLPSKVSEICKVLEIRGYIKIERGYKLKGKAGVATTIEPTEKFLSLIPTDMSYTIMEEGLVVIKEFTPDTFPPYIIETKAILAEYNKTVEPENMLYATHKGSFEVDGRFTGSTVILMSKEDRKHIMINGEATVELDVSNCLPFILSAEYDGRELSKDAYDIDGIPRELVKRGFLMALNCKTREKARKAIQSEINLKYREFNVNGSTLLTRIEYAHPGLKEYFYHDIGRELMNRESRCMANFMRSMLDKGIKFYPIYDSVRVPVSKKQIAMEELKKAFTVGGAEPSIHED